MSDHQEKWADHENGLAAAETAAILEDQAKQWTEPPEPAKPIVVASDMQDVATPPEPFVWTGRTMVTGDSATPEEKIRMPDPKAINSRVSSAVFEYWGNCGEKPRSLYLGVFEHEELRAHAAKYYNFTVSDVPGRKPTLTHLMEYQGMRVFKVDVLSHLGVGR